MANAAGGIDLTDLMDRCLYEAKRSKALTRNKGRWLPIHLGASRNVKPAFNDRTVHALIVRGLLIVIDRQVNSRMPIAVRLAGKDERV